MSVIFASCAGQLYHATLVDDPVMMFLNRCGLVIHFVYIMVYLFWSEVGLHVASGVDVGE